MNRREFFCDVQWQVLKWSPWMGLLGMQFHRYTYGSCAGWAGYITLFGRTIAFVPAK